MDPIAILDLLIAAGSHASIGQTISDARTVYGVVSKAKAAGKFDAAVMVKDGTLVGVTEAAGRLLALFDALLKDKDQAPRVGALLAMFT